jgi:hypothetical protein
MTKVGVESNEPKKQKLTLSDYKIKKEINGGYHAGGHEAAAGDDDDEPYIPSENENSLAELRKTREMNDVNRDRLKIKKEEIDRDIKPNVMAPPSSKPSSSSSSSSFSHLVPLPTISLTDIIPAGSLTSKFNGKSSFQSSSSSSFANSSSLNGGGMSARHFNMSEDEILTNIMSSKHSKRILYTGRKTNENGVFQVPKLLDMCTNVLVNTLDDLPMRIANLSKKIKRGSKSII